jgi:hypothetical protein
MSGPSIRGFDPELALSERNWKQNNRALGAAVASDCFTVYLPAGAFTPQTGAAAGAIAGGGGADYVALSVGAVQSAYCSVLRRSTWDLGAVAFEVAYSGTASSAAPFLLRVRAYGTFDNLDLGTVHGLVALDSIVGPGTLYFERYHTMSGVLALDPTFRRVVFRLQRDGTSGGDTYPGDVLILGATLTFQPYRGV